jgi:hypothetical protein
MWKLLMAGTIVVGGLVACGPKMLPDPLAIPDKVIASDSTIARIAPALAARGFWISFADYESGIVNTDWRLVSVKASFKGKPVDIRDFVQVAAGGGQVLLQYRAQCRYYKPYYWPFGEWTDCRKSEDSTSHPTVFEVLDRIRDELAAALEIRGPVSPPATAPSNQES